MLLAGTLELSSKVRYGLTSRGAPLFRFIPYDKRFTPLAVGCSQRTLFYNVHALVEPSSTDPKRGSLVQNLGTPTLDTELQVLLQTYAYDSQKSLRPSSKTQPLPLPMTYETVSTSRTLVSTAFHVDPPGCRDVDDAFTIVKEATDTYKVSIHIAEVAAWIPANSPLDQQAYQRATSFYDPNGRALAPMFPPAFSEELASLRPGNPKPTLTLSFSLIKGQAPQNFQWSQTLTTITTSYTYDQAQQKATPDLQALQEVATSLGADPKDSHTWVSVLMILYNKQAGQLLRQHNKGLLRKHTGPSQAKTQAYAPFLREYPALQALTQESASYCAPDDESPRHIGLDCDFYAYATSPLRRYADLVNQRALHTILFDTPAPTSPPSLLEDLNRREKQAKAFQRDAFYATALSQTPQDSSSQNSLEGVILCLQETSFKCFIPEWRRIITVKQLSSCSFTPGQTIQLQWWSDPSQSRWKERIVFSPIVEV